MSHCKKATGGNKCDAYIGDQNRSALKNAQN